MKCGILPFSYLRQSNGKQNYVGRRVTVANGISRPPTPVMEGIIEFRNSIMFFIVLIAVFTSWLLYITFLFSWRDPKWKWNVDALGLFGDNLDSYTRNNTFNYSRALVCSALLNRRNDRSLSYHESNRSPMVLELRVFRFFTGNKFLGIWWGAD